MTDIEITYDLSVDAAYISFTGRTPGGSKKMYACDPIEVDGMINLDFDADGRLIGIEVLGASRKLPEGLLNQARRLDKPPV